MRVVLVTLAGAMWGSGMLFHLNPDTQDCFGLHTLDEQELHIAYEVNENSNGEARGVLFTVLQEGSDYELAHSDSFSSDLPPIQVSHGVHEACFQSTSSVRQLVSFDMQTEKHVEVATVKAAEKTAMVVDKVVERNGHVMQQLKFAITREKAHRLLADTMKSRVMWWSLLQGLALCALAGFQVNFLKGFFEVRQRV